MTNVEWCRANAHFGGAKLEYERCVDKLNLIDFCPWIDYG